MSTENVVLEVAVNHEGEVHKAIYFVENGVIHTNIGGKNLRLSHGHLPPEQTVRSVLVGMLQRQSRLAQSLQSHQPKKGERNPSKHVRLL